MAEMLGVPYKELIIIAIVPALFHYFAALVMVHLEARRLKLKGVEPHLSRRSAGDPAVVALVFPLSRW